MVIVVAVGELVVGDVVVDCVAVVIGGFVAGEHDRREVFASI